MVRVVSIGCVPNGFRDRDLYGGWYDADIPTSYRPPDENEPTRKSRTVPKAGPNAEKLEELKQRMLEQRKGS